MSSKVAFSQLAINHCDISAACHAVYPDVNTRTREKHGNTATRAAKWFSSKSNVQVLTSGIATSRESHLILYFFYKKVNLCMLIELVENSNPLDILSSHMAFQTIRTFLRKNC